MSWRGTRSSIHTLAATLILAACGATDPGTVTNEEDGAGDAATTTEDGAEPGEPSPIDEEEQVGPDAESEPDLSIPEPEAEVGSDAQPSEDAAIDDAMPTGDGEAAEADAADLGPEPGAPDATAGAEPEVSQPEPEVSQPEIEVSQPETEVSQPDPEVSQPEPEPEVAQPEPEPEVAGPEPDAETPEPEVSQPEPEVVPEDAAEPEPSWLDPLDATGFCQEQCALIVEACAPFPYSEVDPCLEQCALKLEADPTYISSFVCMEDLCDVVACQLYDVPLPTPALCEEGCERLDDCDLLELVQLQEDEPEMCVAFCTGSVAGTPAIEELVQCLSEGLAEGCDQGAALTCLGEEPPAEGCDAVCAPLYDPASPVFCPPGSLLEETWASEQDCLDACATTLEGEGETAPSGPAILAGCLSLGLCQDPSACVPIPDTFDPACVEACGSYCGASGAVDTCTSDCTGLMLNSVAGTQDEGVAECAAGLEGCEPPLGAAAPLYVECVANAPAACGDVCSFMAACNLFSQDECSFACAYGFFGGEPEVDEMAACVAELTPADCFQAFFCFGGGP